MRILVYKRTHSGDPDEQGRFGIHDCMGEVRGKAYDTVIGIGGIGDEPQRNGIAKKLTWVGIGPHKISSSGRGPLVTFDHFLYYGPKGPPFVEQAPNLAARFYGRDGPRYLLELSDLERREAEQILALAASAPPSPALEDGEPKARRSCLRRAKPDAEPDRTRCRLER